MAPDSAKPELFRLAISGRALTYYKLINATTLDWGTVQSKFKNQFMSKNKQAKMRDELDALHLSALCSDGDSDPQALDKLIARLDKLSLMGSEDDRKDELKIRLLHNAIVNEQWTYFALCKLPVVYYYEESVSILRKSITDFSVFERQRKQSTKEMDLAPPSANENSAKEPMSPWADSRDSKPPPFGSFFIRMQNYVKLSCFNCGTEDCLIGRCPEPLNLKRIASNLEKFKKDKAERSNKNRWSAKNVNLTEIQPSKDEWFDIYEVVVTEAPLDQHNVSVQISSEYTAASSSLSLTLRMRMQASLRHSL